MLKDKKEFLLNVSFLLCMALVVLAGAFILIPEEYQRIAAGCMIVLGILFMGFRIAGLKLSEKDDFDRLHLIFASLFWLFLIAIQVVSVVRNQTMQAAPDNISRKLIVVLLIAILLNDLLIGYIRRRKKNK
jgi:hypothetical protein